MKVQVLIFCLLFCFFGSKQLAAQDTLYLYYDPACMQKFEYTRVDQIRSALHVDYYISTSPKQKAIFKILKDPQNKNRKLVNEVFSMPYMCLDHSRITPDVIASINKATTVAYIMTNYGDQYALYPVYSVATLYEDQETISYQDLQYTFTCPKAGSLPAQDLSQGTSKKERHIYFESKGQMGCLPKYTFKVVSLHQEDPIMRINLISGVGIHRVYSNKGEMRLSKINDDATHDFIKKRCNGTMVVADQPVTPPKADPSPPRPTVIQDTVGMSETEKVLWAAKQNVKETTTAQNPIGNQGIGSTMLGSDNPMGPTTTPQPMDTLPGGYYIVQYQDNLYKISEQFNISPKRLMRLNNLQSFALGLNQRLKVVDDGSVPPSAVNPSIRVDDTQKIKTTVHVVEKGETLYSIAKRYGLKLPELWKMNRQITDQNVIDIDQEIVIKVEAI